MDRRCGIPDENCFYKLNFALIGNRNVVGAEYLGEKSRGGNRYKRKITINGSGPLADCLGIVCVLVDVHAKFYRWYCFLMEPN